MKTKYIGLASKTEKFLYSEIVRLLGEAVYLILLADGEEVGRKAVWTKYIVNFRWDLVSQTLNKIEADSGKNLAGKNLEYRLEKYKIHS